MAYTTGIIYLLLAVATDVIANIFLKKSNGFHNKKYGFASLALIGVAFLFLAQALLTLDLSIAYATWGALGILATTFVDKLFFGLKIKPLGAFGILTMIGGYKRRRLKTFSFCFWFLFLFFIFINKVIERHGNYGCAKAHNQLLGLSLCQKP